MATHEVTFKDSSTEVIEGADAYEQEGPMTTFFATGQGRQVVDCWSTRLASFRTAEIVIIRRLHRELPPVESLPVERVTTHGDAPPPVMFRSAS